MSSKLKHLFEHPRLTPPAALSGTTQVYRGTFSPTVAQIAPHYRAAAKSNPNLKVPSGASDFLNFMEARQHAFGGHMHPFGVSVTTTKSLALHSTGYGKWVIVYNVPNEVFEMLPPGDPCLAEVVFKHSVPCEYAVAILPRTDEARAEVQKRLHQAQLAAEAAKPPAPKRRWYRFNIF